VAAVTQVRILVTALFLAEMQAANLLNDVRGNKGH
jgi:hypothetical protein